MQVKLRNALYKTTMKHNPDIRVKKKYKKYYGVSLPSMYDNGDERKKEEEHLIQDFDTILRKSATFAGILFGLFC